MATEPLALAKLERLKTSIETHRLTQAQARAELWARINAEAPEQASFAAQLRASLGARIVRLDLDGERVIDSSEAEDLETAIRSNRKNRERNLAVERIW